MKSLIWKYLNKMFMISILVFGIISGIFWYYSRELPPLSELQHYQVSAGSEVYDANNKLIHIFAYEYRKLTAYNDLPDHLIKAVITIEDEDFYKHWGMDMLGTLRAVFVDVQRMDFAQGASTISQQLARNMFLSADKKMPRKIKEAMLSVMIEKNFSKNEILEIYLNKIYWGNGIYGVEAASLRYFSKKASELTIGESALLVGMIQRPEYYSPLNHPERAIKRRNLVLNKLLNKKMITEEEYSEALESQIAISQSKETSKKEKSNYFIDYLRQQMERKYGTERVFSGGLKIYATVDMDLQIYADSILTQHLSRLEDIYDYDFKLKDFHREKSNIFTPYLQGGIYAIEPETGYVRILIGGRNFSHSKYNRIMQAKRQPGSVFKPILYTAALEKGFTTATVIKDQPIIFTQSDTVFWEPKNNDNHYYGYTRLRDAIKRSQNVYAIKTILDIGPSSVVTTAKNFGLTTKFLPVYSLAVGTCEVIPYELITAFTTFPNNGERVKPIYASRVEDKLGNVLERPVPEKIRVVDPRIAYLMTSMLETVVNEGTGNVVRSFGYHLPAAGKTGTTDDYRDAWFIGFNRKLVTGIWVGFDDNKPMGNRQTGSAVAAPVWSAVMNKAVMQYTRRKEASDYTFVKPEGLVTTTINRQTGHYASGGNIMQEYFIDGTQPTSSSDSTAYNFYPTHYRTNNKSKFIIQIKN